MNSLATRVLSALGALVAVAVVALVAGLIAWMRRQGHMLGALSDAILGQEEVKDRSGAPIRDPQPGLAAQVKDIRDEQIARGNTGTLFGLSKLSDLRPAQPVQRYEHEAPGDLLHIDTKKLARIVRPSHRVTGNRRDSVGGAGWEMLFVAIDDHARIAFTAMHPDEKTPQAVAFLRQAVDYFAGLGVTVKRLLTDNGSAFRSKAFKAACEELGIRHKFTRAYRPQTNGKAERFIQSALREWAYGVAYQNSADRAQALPHWQHHYNWHRPHAGIGGQPPMSRLNTSRHNVLTLHN